MKIHNLLPSHYLEHQFFDKMFKFLDPKIMQDKDIYLSHDYKKIPAKGENVIVILTAGDEKGKPPIYSRDVGYVFKHHLDSDKIGNVYHLPLPYPNKFSGHSKTPIEERKNDIFFSGCKRSSRNKFIETLNCYVRDKRNVFRFNVKLTNKFGAGYPLDTYCNIMSESKIILSPRGWVRSECLRFSEAVRCGCAIIADRQPNVTCFNDTPYYPVDDWTHFELDKAVQYCLKNQKEIHEGMKYSWLKYFCPQAQAALINKVVGE